MTILKCKMCGGDLNFEEGSTVVECEYCGTKQTVPTIDDEKKITLFARANRLRFACEFDKASGIYESIVADFSTEAEAYWGLVLCKYGIEYVDDPATGKKIPTCHRSSFDSVMEDANFELVMENADPIARSVYREEAKQIEELRRGIIEVSNKEEPYDIFICYKETAENGERTIDSVIAQDVYHELTEKGYRVFFSRITLEDKLGQEYEPYIFAALNSAKIMLAFGTDYEYYNAVWVKNEWSRFLQLIAKGEKKTLIPCYKNIDAYDMPKEFARLQAQDMGKVGAMQDLLRGIEKLLPKKEGAQPGKETGTVQQAQSATIDSLLKRAFMYLEDGDWRNAADYCNRVLDISPENAEAYVGLLMAELQVRKEDELARQTKSYGQNKHFIKAVRFAGEERRKVLEGYSTAVMDYLTEQRQLIEKRLLEEKRRQEEEKRRQEEKRQYLAEKRRQALNRTANAFLSENGIFATKMNGDSRAATIYHRGTHPWKDIDIVTMAVGYGYAVGLKSDGTVVATGDNMWGQCNVSDWRDIIAVYTGDTYTVGLKSDGTVVATGDNRYGQCDVSDWRNIVAVYVSGWLEKYTVGLKSDGTVVEAGRVRWEEYTVDCQDYFAISAAALEHRKECDVSNWRDIVAVYTGDRYFVGLKSDGTVIATGINSSGQCNVSDWRDIVAVYIGANYTVGLKSDGTVVATGDNQYGQCNVSDWRDIVTVYIHVNYTVGLKSDGTVVATGDNRDGQCNVSDWRDIVAIYLHYYRINFGDYHGGFHTVGLKSDGTVVAAGDNQYGQCNVSDWQNIVAVATTSSCIVGLKSDGTVLVNDEIRKMERDWQEDQERQKEEKTERKRQEEERKRRQSNNLCQHCGGEFKGLRTKKCSVCGKPKDYHIHRLK